MSRWSRKPYPIMAATDDGARVRRFARGLSNDLFGIRRELGIGFRVTHLPTGWLMGPQFFCRLKDAVAWCEAVTPLVDWESVTVECAIGSRAEPWAEMQALARRCRLALLRGVGDAFVVEYVEAA